MRLFLGLDTSTFLLQAALLTEAGAAAAEVREEVPTHTPRLPGVLADLLRSAGASSPRELAAVGVTRGPGSFTGLRVGLAAALGLGEGLSVPVFGLSTLEAVARACPAAGRGAVLLDARRGEVYVQFFRKGEGKVLAEGPPASLPPAALNLEGLEWAAGDGISLAPRLPAACRPYPGVAGAAVEAARHALEEWKAGTPPGALSPLYVRRPDVREPAKGAKVP